MQLSEDEITQKYANDACIVLEVHFYQMSINGLVFQ